MSLCKDFAGKCVEASQRADVLMRFLTRDGCEKYLRTTKTSTWKVKEVPKLLVMRADAGVDEL